MTSPKKSVGGPDANKFQKGNQATPTAARKAPKA